MSIYEGEHCFLGVCLAKNVRAHAQYQNIIKKVYVLITAKAMTEGRVMIDALALAPFLR